MACCYVTLQDVMKVLRSCKGEKMRFSSTAFKFASVQDETNRRLNTDLIFKSDYVIIQEDFDDHFNITVEFTSPTEYVVYISDPSKGSGKTSVGAGDIASDVEIELPGPHFVRFEVGTFSGTITTGDKVVIELKAHMSNEVAEEYIRDASMTVDNLLEKGGCFWREADQECIFEVATVPREVKFATKYIAAYYMYTDTFSDIIKEDASSTYSFTSRWNKRAEEMLSTFCHNECRKAGSGLPVVLSFPPKLNTVGVECIGPGLENESFNRADSSTELSADQSIWTEGPDYEDFP